MKNGRCPKCGSCEVYRTRRGGFRCSVSLSTMSLARVDEYVCCGCGLVETFLADMSKVDKIRKKCTKVEATG